VDPTFTDPDEILAALATLEAEAPERLSGAATVEALDEVTFLEVSTPELDDVVRLEDDFGRAGPDGRGPAGGDEA